jgi:hypothetical protein
MAIACAGYRVASVPGHHRLTFEGANLSIGTQAEQLADYFDACRIPVPVETLQTQPIAASYPPCARTELRQ